MEDFNMKIYKYDGIEKLWDKNNWQPYLYGGTPIHAKFDNLRDAKKCIFDLEKMHDYQITLRIALVNGQYFIQWQNNKLKINGGA